MRVVSQLEKHLQAMGVSLESVLVGLAGWIELLLLQVLGVQAPLCPLLYPGPEAKWLPGARRSASYLNWGCSQGQ